MNDSVFSAGTVRSGNTVEIDLSSRVKDGANIISIKIANDATISSFQKCSLMVLI